MTGADRKAREAKQARQAKRDAEMKASKRDLEKIRKAARISKRRWWGR